MNEWIEQFLEHLAIERRVTGNTISAYRNDLRQFGHYLQSTRAARLNGVSDGYKSQLRRELVLDFVLSLKEDSGYAPATVARKVAAVKSLCHYLYKSGAISADPTADLGTPEVKKPLPRAMGVLEVKALLDLADRRGEADGLRDRAMLRLLYATGMRVTEVVSLDLSDLGLEHGTVRCIGRAGKVRTIPVDEKALAAMRHYLDWGRPVLARHNPSEVALFLNHRGQRLTRQGFWLIMKVLARESGIASRITPHMLRHSFAAHQLHDGLALQRLQEILGHANISTTQVYAQVQLRGTPPSSKLGAKSGPEHAAVTGS